MDFVIAVRLSILVYVVTRHICTSLKNVTTWAMFTIFYYFRFLFGRWVKADAAAVFAALLDFGLRRTLPAAEAAFLLVTSLFRPLGI